MKKILKYCIVALLTLLARLVVRRYRPRIVMITGSVGKTSTKDAVASVLSNKFYVWRSEKSFNSEFGVPFTILHVEHPWYNPFAWLTLLKSAIALLILPNHYPKVVVLETGADKPGDLARILRIATPDAVVVTHLPEISVHVEAYASPEAVQEEEFSPAYALSAASPLIVPSDDTYATTHAVQTPAKLYSYGTSDTADLRISDVSFYEVEGRVEGMRAKAHSNGEAVEVVVRGSVGKTQMLPAAAALITGRAFGMSLQDSLDGLAQYEPPPGRGRILAGIHNTTIIDDSYNASPAAVLEALATLKAFPYAKRRVAVLGDMLELGRYSVMEHERIGAMALESADLIVTVGIRARAITSQNVEVVSYDDSTAASRALSELIREGDVILIKGSQSIRTERIVEALLADTADTSKLVRQERVWKRRS